MPADILIVDDEADIRDLVAGILQDEGYGARTARNSDDAMAAIVAQRPNLVFLDIWLQGSKLDGLQLLDAIKLEYPEVPVVMISGHGNIETAVAAIKRGAYDFIEKPFKADRLVLVADRALETSRLKREVKQLKQLAPLPTTLIGRSAAIGQLRQIIDKVAPTNSRILIVGPSGSGKELAARTIHQLVGPRQRARSSSSTPRRSRRSAWKSSCSASTIPTARRGASPARSKRRMAARCSSTTSPICRAKRRTRSCACWSIRPSSASAATTKVAVDVRIVSSTARNLEAAIAEGKFREDLYHRLSVVPIRVPPLAERRDDIPDLVELFHGANFAGHRPAQAAHRRGRHGGAAIARLAGQCAAAAQQYRTADDSRRRRSGRGTQCQHVAARCRLDGAGHAQRQWRRAVDGPAVARRARGVRARISGGADFPFRRQHLAHRRIRRHGALGAAPQAESAGHQGNSPMSRIAYVNGRYLRAGAGQNLDRGPRLPVRRRRLRSLRGEGRPTVGRAPAYGAARSLVD